MTKIKGQIDGFVDEFGINQLVSKSKIVQNVPRNIEVSHCKDYCDKKILIVDDDATNLMALEFILLGLNH